MVKKGWLWLAALLVSCPGFASALGFGDASGLLQQAREQAGRMEESPALAQPPAPGPREPKTRLSPRELDEAYRLDGLAVRRRVKLLHRGFFQRHSIGFFGLGAGPEGRGHIDLTVEGLLSATYSLIRIYADGTIAETVIVDGRTQALASREAQGLLARELAFWLGPAR